MKSRYLLVLLFFFISSEVYSQAYLILRKQGTVRKYDFFAGDEFIYKMDGFENFFRDKIVDFADSTLILQNNVLHLSQLSEVDVRNADSNRSDFLRYMETLLPVIGIGYMALDVINIAIVDGDEYKMESGVLSFTTTMVVTGVGLRLMRKKVFKLHKPYREAYIVGVR